MAYTTRIATLADLPVLLEFEQELIREERPMDPTMKDGKISYYDVSEFIRDPNAEVYVAEHQGSVVASGCVRIRPDRHYLRHEKMGYLGFMYVRKAHRGLGINGLIIKDLLSWCRERGLYEVRLDVYEVNLPAIRAYEKAGLKKHLAQMRMDIRDLDLD